LEDSRRGRYRSSASCRQRDGRPAGDATRAGARRRATPAQQQHTPYTYRHHQQLVRLPLSKINLFVFFPAGRRRPTLGEHAVSDAVSARRRRWCAARRVGRSAAAAAGRPLTGSQPWTSRRAGRWAARGRRAAAAAMEEVTARGAPPPHTLTHAHTDTGAGGAGARRSQGGLYTAVRRRRRDLAPGLYNNARARADRGPAVRARARRVL